MKSVHRTPAWVLIPLFLLFTILLTVAAWILVGMPTRHVSEVSIDATANTVPFPITCVVIDAGHGGEDGGASSAAGDVEKDLNLAVALALRDQLEAAGVPTVMTRTEDKLLYDRTVDYQGRKKVLDLAARRTIADETAGCLLISVHMNAFPETKYSGMQVWYGAQDARSKTIAQAIQAGALALDPDNHRREKAAGSNIYLLEHAACPAVLVECGFLSNPEEAARLADPEYQHTLATVILSAILPYMEDF